jgi:hypothetical protein
LKLIAGNGQELKVEFAKVELAQLKMIPNIAASVINAVEQNNIFMKSPK